MDTDRILRHDARNILNSLRLNLEAFRLVQTQEDRLECLEAIERAAESALTWVDRFESHQSDGQSPS